MQLEDLRAFLDDISAFIKTRAAHLASSRPAEWDVTHEEQEYRYEEAFGTIVRQSFLLSLATILEYAISNFLRVVQEWRAIPISPSDLRGDLLEKIKVYGFRLGSLKIDVSPELWQDMESVTAIRNCLVHHAGGVLNNPQKGKIQAFSDRHQGLVIEEGHLQVTEELCLESYGVVKAFLDTLYAGACRAAQDEAAT